MAKKILILLMALTMVMVFMPMNVYADGEKTITGISYDRPDNEIYENTNGEFRDTADGGYYYYYINSMSSNDTLTLYYSDETHVVYHGFYNNEENRMEFRSEEGDVILANDLTVTDDQEENHFAVGGGNYYYIEYQGVRCSVEIVIVAKMVNSITFTPASTAVIYENSNGHWDSNNGEEFYNYDIPDFKEGDVLTVEFNDDRGTVNFTYNDSNEFMDANGNILPNSDLSVWKHNEPYWVIGGENYYYVKYQGVDSQPVPVTITANPVQGISFTPVNAAVYREGENMYYDDWDHAYYYSYPPFENGDKLTVNTPDGPVVYTYQNEGWQFVSPAGDVIEERDLIRGSDQKVSPWTVGVNYFFIEYMGKQCNVPVTIVSNPVDAITYTPVEPFTVTEGADMYYDEYDGRYYYHTPNIGRPGDVLTIEYNDGRGTVAYTAARDSNTGDIVFRASNGDTIPFDDKFSFYANQRDNPWTVGGDNYVTITYSGKSYNIPVTVIENTVTGISYHKVKKIEVFINSGYTAYGPNGEYTRFDYDEFSAGDQLTVSDSNLGDIVYTYTFDETDHEWYFVNGENRIERHDLYVHDDQETNPWSEIGTYYFTIEYLGQTTTVPVSLIESDVSSIEYQRANEVVFTEQEGGEFVEDPQFGRFYYYHPGLASDGDRLTVHYKTGETVVYVFDQNENVFKAEDGSTIGLGNDEVDIRDDNQYQNHWEPDKDNYFTVSYRGATTNVPVRINHVFKETITKATTKADGSIVTKCEKCGKVSSKKVIPRIKSFTLSATAYVYDGKTKTPSVTVKDAKGNTIKAANYTVTRSTGRKNVGEYSVTITMKGNYNAKKVLKFQINPKGTSLKSVSAISKGLKVNWTAQSSRMAKERITGYKVMIATDKAFKKNTKTFTVSGYSKKSLKITKLKAKKAYYVKIRTYKKIGKTYFYSKWSKAIKKTTLK